MCSNKDRLILKDKEFSAQTQRGTEANLKISRASQLPLRNCPKTKIRCELESNRLRAPNKKTRKKRKIHTDAERCIDIHKSYTLTVHTPSSHTRTHEYPPTARAASPRSPGVSFLSSRKRLGLPTRDVYGSHLGMSAGPRRYRQSLRSRSRSSSTPQEPEICHRH